MTTIDTTTTDQQWDALNADLHQLAEDFPGLGHSIAFKPAGVVAPTFPRAGRDALDHDRLWWCLRPDGMAGPIALVAMVEGPHEAAQDDELAERWTVALWTRFRDWTSDDPGYDLQDAAVRWPELVQTLARLSGHAAGFQANASRVVAPAIHRLAWAGDLACSSTITGWAKRSEPAIIPTRGSFKPDAVTGGPPRPMPEHGSPAADGWWTSSIAPAADTLGELAVLLRRGAVPAAAPVAASPSGGLTDVEANVLQALAESAPRRIKRTELALASGHSETTVRNALEAMEGRGLVDPGPRGSRKGVGITSDGMRKVDALGAARR